MFEIAHYHEHYFIMMTLKFTFLQQWACFQYFLKKRGGGGGMSLKSVLTLIG